MMILQRALPRKELVRHICFELLLIVLGSVIIHRTPDDDVCTDCCWFPNAYFQHAPLQSQLEENRMALDSRLVSYCEGQREVESLGVFGYEEYLFLICSKKEDTQERKASSSKK